MGLDFPLLLTKLWGEEKIFLRALADHSHFQVKQRREGDKNQELYYLLTYPQVPINAMIMRDVLGAVDGTRRNVDLLMEKQGIFHSSSLFFPFSLIRKIYLLLLFFSPPSACIFVYPGGARETFKRTTDKKYEIIWGNRTGFAEMALRYGCTIVPVTNYGTEDMVIFF